MDITPLTSEPQRGTSARFRGRREWTGVGKEGHPGDRTDLGHVQVTSVLSQGADPAFSPIPLQNYSQEPAGPSQSICNTPT